MPAPDPYRPFIERLEASGLPYCLTGSVAAGIYGEYRLTADIDFVLRLPVENIASLRAAFPEEEFYVPPTEVLVGETARAHRGKFNLIDQATLFKAGVFLAARDPLHRWALDHRRRANWRDLVLWIAPPEYVIIRKLEAFREGGQEKHPQDILAMLAVTEIDRAFIEQHVERLGLQEQWLLSSRKD